MLGRSPVAGASAFVVAAGPGLAAGLAAAGLSVVASGGGGSGGGASSAAKARPAGATKQSIPAKTTAIDNVVGLIGKPRDWDNGPGLWGQRRASPGRTAQRA